MKTLSFCSSSSASASFNASRTVISLTPLGVAYLLVFAIDGSGKAVGRKEGLVVAAAGRVEDSSREAGRSMREVTMTTRSGECKGGKDTGFGEDVEASDSCLKLWERWCAY